MLSENTLSKNKANILITGATGLIGSHLAERLIAQGEQIRILVMKNPLQKIEHQTLGELKKYNIEIIYGDLRDKDSLKPALEGINTIFHCAAISRPMNIPKKMYYDINTLGTKNLLETCLGQNINRYIHISAISVLGVSPDGHPLKENEYQPEKFLDDYDLSKKQAEKIVLDFYKRYKLPVIILRPPMVYGPRCMARLIMFTHVKNRILPLFRNGKGHMEFCYIDNLIDAILLATSSPKALGQIYNLSDEKAYPMSTVIGTIAKELGVGLCPISGLVIPAKILGYLMAVAGKIFRFYHPFSPQVVDWMSYNRCVYDISKAKKELGYYSRVSLREGIKESVKWYRDKGLI